jgi:very-short-patch-repair endonuclease
VSDFRHQVHPVIIEVQSERYHASLSSRRDDKLRRDKLEAAGFIVAEVWDRQLWHAPDEARDIVRAALRRVAKLAS